MCTNKVSFTDISATGCKTSNIAILVLTNIIVITCEFAFLIINSSIVCNVIL